MAETTTKTATPRSRSTAARKPRAAAKPVAPATEETTPPEAGRQKLTASLAYLDDTKSYSRFDLSHDVDGNATGCVGKVYAPLGTEVVKILIEGPMGSAE